MKISIITPVLNRVDTLERTLRSVSMQTYEDIEHIIQDGGSTDGSASLASTWRSPHPVRVQSARDRGIYDAINTGIARCDGDVIGLLGSDDYLADPQVIRDVANALTKDVDGIYGDLDLISASGRVLRHWRAGPFRRNRMQWGWAPPHPTLYLRREVFNRLGAYDADYRIAGDYDAMLRWIWAGDIRLAYLPRVLVKMAQGGASTGSALGLWTKTREDYRALRRHKAGGLGTLAAKNLRKVGQFRALMWGAGH
ncbi:glycosyltransferase family 2 protein [Ruegeria sp.]|uniref:glycosyltransferase family 2 protein n=1 Tax=Ruegeria sp. TaxID=1879320 RepID=UPI0023285FA5|nr:glycosyltransferase family 2 protein [Ruegeria sp.]MDA7963542.1 glycosyltransferase [Ruegeria sp.]